MDHCEMSASVFHNCAGEYREKFGSLTLYDEFYVAFCRLLKPGRARVLDVACGPGNVARFLMAQRPELDLLGIDLAPRMVEFAREAAPSARFSVCDCRRLTGLQQRFDGIICAFGLPYLSGEEAGAFIRSAAEVLEPAGVLYLSTMLGRSEDSGVHKVSTGDEVHVFYHTEAFILSLLQAAGFSVLLQEKLASPSNASQRTTDLIVVAQRVSA
jgi:ubiquinone/menaquinone biosynthesis C-methylase UbiE